MKLLMPFHCFWKTLYSIEEDGGEGQVSPTFEIRNIMDGARDNKSKLWTHDDMPMQAAIQEVATWSHFFEDYMPASANTAFWIKADPEIADQVDGADNYMWYAVDATGSPPYTPLDVYEGWGDGNPGAGDTEWDCDTHTGDDFQLVLAAEGAITTIYQYAILGNYSGTPANGTYIDFFEYMHGFLIDMPADGHLNEEHSLAREWHGAGVRKGGMGAALGIHSATSAPRKSRALKFTALTESERWLLWSVVKYGRGCIPVLLMIDENDKTTWMKCILQSIKTEEPEAESWTVTIRIEEV